LPNICPILDGNDIAVSTPPPKSGFQYTKIILYLKDVPTEETLVLKYPIWEPYKYYRTFTGKGKKYTALMLLLPQNKSKKCRFLKEPSLWLRS
jgi:hypothetical protein